MEFFYVATRTRVFPHTKCQLFRFVIFCLLLREQDTLWFHTLSIESHLLQRGRKSRNRKFLPFDLNPTKCFLVWYLDECFFFHECKAVLLKSALWKTRLRFRILVYLENEWKECHLRFIPTLCKDCLLTNDRWRDALFEDVSIGTEFVFLA